MARLADEEAARLSPSGYDLAATAESRKCREVKTPTIAAFDSAEALLGRHVESTTLPLKQFAQASDKDSTRKMNVARATWSPMLPALAKLAANGAVRFAAPAARLLFVYL